MAYNTIGSEQIRYPPVNINRSPSIPIQKAMPPQMPMHLPVTSSQQPPAPVTKRRLTKKQKEQQQQEHQLQSPQINGVMPNFPPPMPMELSRASSSHDLPTRSSPGTIPMHLKGL